MFHKFELQSELGVAEPLPFHLDNFACRWGNQMADDRDEIRPVRYLHLNNGESIFFVGIGYVFDLARQVA